MVESVCEDVDEYTILHMAYTLCSPYKQYSCFYPNHPTSQASLYCTRQPSTLHRAYKAAVFSLIPEHTVLGIGQS